MKEKFLTTKEVIDQLRVDERSVIRYIKSRKLKTSKIGQWRIKERDLALNTIAKIKTGEKSNPTIETLEKIAKAFSVSVKINRIIP